MVPNPTGLSKTDPMRTSGRRYGGEEEVEEFKAGARSGGLVGKGDDNDVDDDENADEIDDGTRAARGDGGVPSDGGNNMKFSSFGFWSLLALMDSEINSGVRSFGAILEENTSRVIFNAFKRDSRPLSVFSEPDVMM